MKTIFKVHPIYVLTALVCFMIGYFRLFITTTFIILFHELGHIFMMLVFNVKIEKVILLPFGGITITNDIINRSLKEELLIALMGPVFQIIYFLLFKNDYLIMIHYPLLIFNLLPIVPLDGSKILGVILNRFYSFYKCEIMIVVISFISILLVLVINFNIIMFIILMFLFIETYKRYRMRGYIFYKFLYERKNYEFKFKRRKRVEKKTDMFKDCYHIFYDDNRYYTEREYLKNSL